MTWQRASVISVWLVVAVLATFGGLVLPPGNRLGAIPLLFAGAIVTSFVTQLAIQRKEGFVDRVMASISGSILILAVATILIITV
jgi:hypothetical protein